MSEFSAWIIEGTPMVLLGQLSERSGLFWVYNKRGFVPWRWGLLLLYHFSLKEIRLFVSLSFLMPIGSIPQYYRQNWPFNLCNGLNLRKNGFQTKRVNPHGKVSRKHSPSSSRKGAEMLRFFTSSYTTELSTFSWTHDRSLSVHLTQINASALCTLAVIDSSERYYASVFLCLIMTNSCNSINTETNQLLTDKHFPCGFVCLAVWPLDSTC